MGMKKGELQKKANITASIMARLAKNETVKTDTIGKICEALECQPGDIMEYINDIAFNEESRKAGRYTEIKKVLNKHDETEEISSEEIFVSREDKEELESLIAKIEKEESRT